MLKDVLNKKGLTKKKKRKEKIVRAPPLPESMRMAEVLVICLQPSGACQGCNWLPKHPMPRTIDTPLHSC